MSRSGVGCFHRPLHVESNAAQFRAAFLRARRASPSCRPYFVAIRCRRPLGDIMKKIICVAAIAVALMAVLPAATAQQADPPRPTLTAKLKQKYLERRAKLVDQVKDIYFAVGCKILPGDAGARSVARRDHDLAAIRDQAVLDLKEDQELVEAAKQQGMERAARPGACDYYRRHPKAAEAMRREAGEAEKRKQ